MSVKDQLDLLDGDLKVLHKGEYSLIQCPYHKDGQESHPSLMVNISNPRYEEGFFYCLSCGEKGSWSKLADNLNLEVTPSKNTTSKTLVSTLSISTPKLSIPSSLEALWDKRRVWRGINGALLRDLEATLKFNPITKEQDLILPVRIMAKVVGTITCKLEKDKEGKSPSYINSPGPWIKKALFPYDQALKTIREDQETSLPLFIVEGPRDALNLLQLGLPAVSILGGFNWDKELAIILTVFNPSYYIVMMDGDEAGEKANSLVYKDLVRCFGPSKVRVCRLPRGKDPANLDKKHAANLKSLYSYPK